MSGPTGRCFWSLPTAYAACLTWFVLRVGLAANQRYAGRSRCQYGCESCAAYYRTLFTANLIAGAMLAFAFSMLEVSDGLMLAQREDYYLITKTIYELFQLIGTGQYVASALGVWAMLFLAITIIDCSLLLGKKMGALFRI
jgi:hypothetical protein